MSSASSKSPAPAPARYDVAFSFSPPNPVKIKPHTPAVTILGWVVLGTSFIGILCAAGGLAGKDHILNSNNHFSTAISSPNTRWFFTRNWNTIAYVMLGLFTLTGLCALGILARIKAAYVIARYLLFAAALFCVFQTLGRIAYDLELTPSESMLVPWDIVKGLIFAGVCVVLFKLLNLQIFKKDFTPVAAPEPLISLAGALDIDSAKLKKPGQSP